MSDPALRAGIVKQEGRVSHVYTQFHNSQVGRAVVSGFHFVLVAPVTEQLHFSRTQSKKKPDELSHVKHIDHFLQKFGKDMELKVKGYIYSIKHPKIKII